MRLSLLTAILLTAPSVLAAVYDASFRIEGAPFAVAPPDGRSYCALEKTSESTRFRAVFRGMDQNFYLNLENFDADLVESGQASFDFRQDETNSSTILLDEKPTFTRFEWNANLDGGCSGELYLIGQDVQGLIQCTNLSKYQNESKVKDGISLEGRFLCPYLKLD